MTQTEKLFHFLTKQLQNTDAGSSTLLSVSADKTSIQAVFSGEFYVPQRVEANSEVVPELQHTETHY